MKKAVVILLLVFFTVLFAPTFASAKSPEEYIDEYSAVIPDRLSGMLSDGDGLSDAVGLSSLSSFVLLELSGKRTEIFSFFLLLLGIVAISALCASVFENMKEGVRRGISIASSAALFSALLPLLSSVKSSLSEANGFFLAASPVVCAINLAEGGMGSAAIGAAGMSLTASFIATVSTKVLPFLGVMGLASSLLGNFGGSLNIAKSAGKLYTRVFGILALLISVTLSLQTVVASAGDSALMRAAKYGVTTLIPSVGGVVSGAMSTLAGGLSYAKSIVGASAIGVMLYIFISPLLLLLLYRLGMSVALSMTELLGAQDISALSSFVAVLDSFITSYAIAVIMYILQLLLLMKGGAAW